MISLPREEGQKNVDQLDNRAKEGRGRKEGTNEGGNDKGGNKCVKNCMKQTAKTQEIRQTYSLTAAAAAEKLNTTETNSHTLTQVTKTMFDIKTHKQKAQLKVQV